MTDNLSIQQIAILKEQLQTTQDELSRLLQLSEKSSDIVELDQSSVGRLSRMDAIQQQQMARAGKRRLQLQRAQITKAMNKIADAEYGYCIECDEIIAFARLQIRPESELCVVCQNKREVGQ